MHFIPDIECQQSATETAVMVYRQGFPGHGFEDIASSQRSVSVHPRSVKRLKMRQDFHIH